MAATFLPARSAESRVETPALISIHADTPPGQVMDAYVASRLLDRSFQVTASFVVPHSFPPALLAPPAMSVVHEANMVTSRLLHLEISGQADVQIWEWEGATRVELAGRSHAIVSSLWEDIRTKILAEVRGEAFVPSYLWSFPEGKPMQRSHRMPAVEWGDARRNYPEQTAEKIDWLMGLVAPERVKGRLLLWHGPSGTGKTTAAVSLMTAWQPWCDLHVISDPEEFFRDPSYLLEVSRQVSKVGIHQPLQTMNEAAPRRWKLIVCEDADEYLRSDAKLRSGPALGRLLNLTDGMLGRNSRAMVLLTTNDSISRLHPAVRRPGRCMAEISFPALNPSEASAWCPEGVQPPASGATLAELFALRDGQGFQYDEPEATGMYL